MAQSPLPMSRKIHYLDSTILSLAVSLPFFVVMGVSMATPTLLGQTTTLGVVLPQLSLPAHKPNTLWVKTLEGESISLLKTHLSLAPGMQISLIMDFYDDGSIEYRLDNEARNSYTGNP